MQIPLCMYLHLKIQHKDKGIELALSCHVTGFTMLLSSWLVKNSSDRKQCWTLTERASFRLLLGWYQNGRLEITQKLSKTGKLKVVLFKSGEPTATSFKDGGSSPSFKEALIALQIQLCTPLTAAQRRKEGHGWSPQVAIACSHTPKNLIHCFRIYRLKRLLGRIASSCLDTHTGPSFPWSWES